MDLLHARAALPLVLFGWIAFAMALIVARSRVRRPVFRIEAEEHAWYGGALLLALLWLLPIKIAHGPAFGMLGGGIYCLVFGPARGMFGLALAVLVHTACAHGDWANLGINASLLAAAPAGISCASQRFIARFLPRHLFVFLLGNGMISTLLATAIPGLLAQVAARASAADVTDLGWSQSLGPMLLLAYGEAIASGMLFSALVVFAPQAVRTYDADLYLARVPRGRSPH
jgi:uncharacterized membrane protein